MRNWQSISKSNPLPNATRMVGFVPYTPGIVVTGVVEKAVMKAPTKGFFMIRVEEQVTVSTRDELGDAVAQPGALVGLRYCHSLRSLGTFIGRTVRVTFVGTETRENYVYHRWHVELDVDDSEPRTEEKQHPVTPESLAKLYHSIDKENA